MCVQSQCFASEDFGTAPVAKTVQRYHTHEYSCGEAEVQQAASEASETLSRSTNNSRCYGSLRTMKHDLLGITVCSIASITANRIRDARPESQLASNHGRAPGTARKAACKRASVRDLVETRSGNRRRSRNTPPHSRDRARCTHSHFRTLFHHRRGIEAAVDWCN